MNKHSIQAGWKWEEVKDFEGWKIPDGGVMRLIYLLGRDSDKKVYDLGCGIGRHTVFFASHGFQVCASDISIEAVKKTKEWLKKENLIAEVQQGLMTNINQPDGTFDLVISLNVIYHALRDDIIKAIEEVFRILKPGGYFHGTFLTKKRNVSFTDENNIILDDQTIMIKGGIEDGIPHFFSHTEDVLNFLSKFYIESLVRVELFQPPYTLENISSQQSGEYIRFLAKKPN